MGDHLHLRYVAKLRRNRTGEQIVEGRSSVIPKSAHGMRRMWIWVEQGCTAAEIWWKSSIQSVRVKEPATKTITRSFLFGSRQKPHKFDMFPSSGGIGPVSLLEKRFLKRANQEGREHTFSCNHWRICVQRCHFRCSERKRNCSRELVRIQRPIWKKISII